MTAHEIAYSLIAGGALLLAAFDAWAEHRRNPKP